MDAELDFFDDLPPVPKQHSYVGWLYDCIGPTYTVLIFHVALLSLVGIVLLLVYGRNRFVGAAILSILPAGPMLGIYAFIERFIASFHTVQISPQTPRISDIAVNFAFALVPLMVTLALSAPAHLAAIIGLSIRSLRAEVMPSTRDRSLSILGTSHGS